MTRMKWPPDLPSPVQPVHWSLTVECGIKMWVKRDDLIHDWVSGNKYRKLKYNLQKVKNSEYKGILTFGGAFSNHLYAVAGVCKLEGIASVGIIRGDGFDPANPTLAFYKSAGMKMYFVSRTEYRSITDDIIQNILINYPDYLIVPEGGSNEDGVLGASEIMHEFYSQCDIQPDYVLVAGGTGGTAAGILQSLKPSTALRVYGALKSDYLIQEIHRLSRLEQLPSGFRYYPETIFGGYARWNQELLDFITEFESETGIEIDHIYNAKLLYAFKEHMKNGVIPSGSRVLWIHTGGLQGKAGLRYRMHKKQNSGIVH
ncbi:MAG: pyridoxal-phosphate dependent enzyme [Saprospiraceae bacterium]|nr:pyridoxal-phosphate dependent enzyme [Saprospiraceae bacterium]